MGFVDVGVNIKAHNSDALRGIAAVKLALKGLRNEQNLTAARQKYLAQQSAAVTRALHQQSRSVRTLTLDYFGLRRAILTLAARTAVTGLTALTSALNSLGVAAVTAGTSLANLGGASIMGALAGLGAAAQGVSVLAFALQDLGKAYTTVGKQHEDALAKLTKPARQFYSQTKELTQGIRELKLIAQEGLFPGLVEAFKELGPLAEIVKQNVYDTATTIGYLAERAADMASRRGPELNRILTRNVITMRRMGVAAEDFGAAAIDFMVAGGPLIGRMTRDLVTFAKQTKESFAEWRKDGSLGQFFADLRKSWENWTAIFGATFKGLFGIWKAIQPVVHEVENAIESSAKKFSEWANTAENQVGIERFFRDSLGPMKEFLGLLGDLGKLWVDFAQAGNDDAERFFRGIRTNLLPILRELFLYIDDKLLPKLMDIGDAFLDLVRTALPGIKTVISALGPFAEVMEAILRAASDVIEFFNEFNSVSGAIATLGVGAAVISSWHKLRTAIGLTLLSIRAAGGAPGAVMPGRRQWGGVIPGRGFVRGSRNVVSWGRNIPGNIRDRSGELVERGARRSGMLTAPTVVTTPRVGSVAQRMGNAGLSVPGGFLLDRQPTFMSRVRRGTGGVSAGGVILPTGVPSQFATNLAKTTKSGFLTGLRAAAGGIAATGIPQAIAISAALVAAPMLVEGAVKLIKDNRPKLVKRLGDLGGDQRYGLGGPATAFNNEQLAKATDDLERFIKAGDSEGMRQVAVNVQKVADAAENLDKKQALTKAAEDIRRLAVNTDTALLSKVIPDFEAFAQRGDTSIGKIRDGLSVLKIQIGNKIPESSGTYKEAMASAFGQAAAQVKAAMDAGLISIKKGTREYRRLLRQQFITLGFEASQVRGLIRTGGVDFQGKSGGFENPGGVDINFGKQHLQGRAPAPGANRIDRAIGGGFYLGAKGERGRDTIPMNIAGQQVMAGRGEYVGIFNAQQQKAFSQMAAMHGYGGMEGFFKANDRPHYMAQGGIVGLGRRLVNMGYDVGEHPAFGGVSGVHVPNSYHYRGQALDVNADHWPQGEMRALDQLNAMLRNQGWHTLWRVAGHFDHLHVDTANGPGGVVAMLKKLGRIEVGGDGLLGGLAQGILDRFRSGANAVIDRVNGMFTSTGGDVGSVNPSLVGGDAQENMRLGRAMMLAFGWPQSEWPALRALGMGESGWRSSARNQGSGAFGIGQFLGQTKTAYAKYGAASAVPKDQINAMLHYIQDRYGSPSKAYSFWLSQSPHWYEQGGLLYAFAGNPPPRQDGYPDVNPQDAVPTDPRKAKERKRDERKSGKSKDKKKKPRFYANGRPVYGAGYGRQDFRPRKRKPKRPRPSRRARRLGRFFKQQTLKLIDPFTGEETNIFEKFFNDYQKIADNWNIDLELMEGRHGLSEEEAIVTLPDGTDVLNSSGMRVEGRWIPGITQALGELDELLGVHERRPFPGALTGKPGLLGLYETQRQFLRNIPADKAIRQRETRLRKIKRFFHSTVRLRKKYGEKMQKMRRRNIGWKKAVSVNEGIIRDWRRWLRDSDETPAQRRRAYGEIDRLEDENRWLKEHRPRRMGAGSKTFRAAEHHYRQAGSDLRYLTGHPNLMKWDPSQFGVNSVAGKTINDLLWWRETKQFKDEGLFSLKSTIGNEGITIQGIRNAYQEWAGTKAPPKPSTTPDTSERDQLLRQIGLDALRGKFVSGLQFNTLTDFAQLLGMRNIGTFARGGLIRETGMALVHKGETILPDPDGPFRRGMNAPASVSVTPNITLILQGESGELVKLVDARIDDKVVPIVNRRVGRTARVIAVAPGR